MNSIAKKKKLAKTLSLKKVKLASKGQVLAPKNEAHNGGQFERNPKTYVGRKGKEGDERFPKLRDEMAQAIP